MPNWCDTRCTLTGPEADIERFKQACLFVDPEPGHNGIDFERIIPIPDDVLRCGEAMDSNGLPRWLNWACENWGTKWQPVDSVYCVEDGRHKLYMTTAGSPPIPVLEKIVLMFPTLALTDIDISEEMGSFFYKGTISASGTDLVKDEEATQQWDEAMKALCAEA